MRFPPIFSPRLWANLLIVRPLMRLVFGVSVRGRENLAGLGQFILVANHNSHMDTLVLSSILPLRHLLRTHPVAASDYFSGRPVLGRLAGFLFRPCWIDRRAPAEESLGRMRALLDDGGSLILFPEGTRGEPGRIAPFRGGVGRLAESHPGIALVPAFLSGPERSLPKARALPLPLYSYVTVGPPQVHRGEGREITASLEALVRELSESETAGRHRRHAPRGEPFSVAVTGIDGSGKSTLSSLLARDLSAGGLVCRVSDRLEFFEDGRERDLQPLLAETLRRRLGGLARSARSLERYKIPKLAEMMLRERLIGELRRWYGPEVVVLDGTPLVNLMAWVRVYRTEAFEEALCRDALRLVTVAAGGQTRDWSAAISPAREKEVLAKLPELAALRRLGLGKFHRPRALVLLDASPALSLRRIRERNSATQAHETEEHLALLRDGYLTAARVAGETLGIPTLILDAGSDLESLGTACRELIDRARSTQSARSARPGGDTHDPVPR